MRSLTTGSPKITIGSRSQGIETYVNPLLSGRPVDDESEPKKLSTATDKVLCVTVIMPPSREE